MLPISQGIVFDTYVGGGLKMPRRVIQRGDKCDNKYC